ncbi:MAG: virulence RhuM family protein [Sedimentisphaerales bacterium]|nr:virulence RhuM family protein [Sedimentisphaerales bacterium]HOH65607.1 virulence RhuM family protein [Sedimentisphaerales bacterium]HQN36027.1 virulence RhuM family protein [Sedimentisphaerales bacterium]
MLEGETVWLTQNLLAELYQTTKQNISLHIQNIYKEGELVPEATVKKYLTVRQEGSRTVQRPIDHYNLDMIIAVGYRVKSPVATAFRQWATARLREYLVKGFTLNDERLKGTDSVTDYFDELLARIREIRASEARVYQRIREIFALAVDYREGEQETQLFFATMQNKIHYAATGHTAAEIIRRRADGNKPNMGLTAWKGDRVIKRDVGTAKNYLDPKEIDTLNRITVMFLDQAEFRAQRRQDIHMHDWRAFLDKFLRDTELPVLADAGSVSHEDALEWASEQYDAFAQRRRLEAEKQAEARYIEDLRYSTENIKQQRKNLPSKKQAKAKKQAPKRKPGRGDQP